MQSLNEIIEYELGIESIYIIEPDRRHVHNVRRHDTHDKWAFFYCFSDVFRVDWICFGRYAIWFDRIMLPHQMAVVRVQWGTVWLTRRPRTTFFAAMLHRFDFVAIASMQLASMCLLVDCKSHTRCVLQIGCHHLCHCAGAERNQRHTHTHTRRVTTVMTINDRHKNQPAVQHPSPPFPTKSSQGDISTERRASSEREGEKQIRREKRRGQVSKTTPIYTIYILLPRQQSRERMGKKYGLSCKNEKKPIHKLHQHQYQRHE